MLKDIHITVDSITIVLKKYSIQRSDNGETGIQLKSLTNARTYLCFYLPLRRPMLVEKRDCSMAMKCLESGEGGKEGGIEKGKEGKKKKKKKRW